jgi:hypothetical protein
VLPLRRLALVLFLAASVLLAGRTPARADEVAPALEGADLRVRARGELRRLVGTLSDGERRRLAGVYVAFDASPSDPIAQVACDDDGDPVVLLSDAMLLLLSHVARAATHDERARPEKIDAYASFVARAQVPGRRLLPPAPGFFTTDQETDAYEDRLVEAIAFVVAEELERLRAGDLVCPSPTATRESGDDAWTPREAERAAAVARTTYPARQLERSASAAARVRQSGRTEQGALAVARFFDRFEAERSRFSPSYAATHPSAAARRDAVERATTR